MARLAPTEMSRPRVSGRAAGRTRLAFWIVAGGLALSVGALLARTILRPSGPMAPAASRDAEVYRDQLKEIDRDLARGVLAADEARNVRVEVSRRLLEADRRSGASTGTGRAPRAAGLAGAGFALLAAAVGAPALYGMIGAPGYGDQPLAARIESARKAREERPAQAVAEAAAAARPRPGTTDPDPAYLKLVEKLRAALVDRPYDLEGHRLLARNEAGLGNFAAAYAAQERVLEILGESALASDHVDLADLMILAAGGYVSPEAETALHAALALDPANGTARYYMGLMHAQTGRPDLAFRAWGALLDESPPDAPWTAPIEARIGEIARLAGVRFELPANSGSASPPPLGSGPTREQIEAAAEMDPQERTDMIRGMVEGLALRLAEEGGPPEDWARLVDALGVLGETGRARAIWDEARQAFADAPQALAAIRAAAARAGVAN